MFLICGGILYRKLYDCNYGKCYRGKVDGDVRVCNGEI